MCPVSHTQDDDDVQLCVETFPVTYSVWEKGGCHGTLFLLCFRLQLNVAEGNGFNVPILMNDLFDFLMTCLQSCHL